MKLDHPADAPKVTQLSDYLPYSHLLTHTELTFDIRSEQEVRVLAKLSFAPNPAAKDHGQLVLNGNDKIQLHAVKLNGVETKYNRTNGLLTISSLPNAPFVLETEATINPEANTELAGLYTSGGKFCTQCEALGFRNITFFPDRPDVMSEYVTHILADGKRYPQMLANGNLVKDETLPDGKRKVTWHDPFKKPCYLFALVAADLAMLEDHFTTMSGRRVTLQMFTDHPAEGGDASALRQLTHAMDSLQRSMKWDEERFGREYDLDLFMVVAVDDFNFGAMENKGLNIFNSKALLATPETATDGRYARVESVVAHEYFHNWTGNRITCRDWFQLCLKEGLTVFRDQEFSADTHSRVLQRIADARFMRSTQFGEDAGPNAHPIRPDSFVTVENFYTTTIYEKGSEVIRMMHTMLGEDGFRKGTDLYFERHDGQAVTTEDFVRCMADANGADLQAFEQSWYNQAGTPTLSAHDSYDAATKRYTLTLSQSCPPVPREVESGKNKRPYVMPVKLGLLDAEGNDLPLTLEDATSERLLHGDVLMLRDEEETFVFINVPCKPVPSLLRDFSAPVRLKYAYSPEALALRVAKDADGFNRWEAAQNLAVQVLQRMIIAYRAGKEMVVDSAFLEAYRTMLKAETLGADMKAEMFSLPSHDYLAGLYANGDVDPHAIEAARDALRMAMAQALESELAAAYEQHRSTPGDAYHFTKEEVARRALANIALYFLLALPKPDKYAAWAQTQQSKASNFTDEMGAFAALTEHHETIGNAATRQKAMDDFFTKWQQDALVIDSWLMREAAIDRTDALARTQTLMNGPFPRDFTNPEKLKPNKVRAILGGFTDGNPVQFHRADGAGYAFLADQILMLDAVNAKLAARLVNSLCDWARFEKPRAAQMHAQLVRIQAHPGLSTDTTEIVGNALKSA